MNIIVCGKVIPASSVTIEIDPNTKRMVRKGVTHELDPAAANEEIAELNAVASQAPKRPLP